MKSSCVRCKSLAGVFSSVVTRSRHGRGKVLCGESFCLSIVDVFSIIFVRNNTVFECKITSRLLVRRNQEIRHQPQNKSASSFGLSGDSATTCIPQSNSSQANRTENRIGDGSRDKRDVHNRPILRVEASIDYFHVDAPAI